MKKGFTLTELLVVILLVSIATLMIVPFIQSLIHKTLMSKYETSYESLVRQIQTTSERKTYVITNGLVYPNVETNGTIDGNGTITVDGEGNAEVQIQIGNSEYCVFKNYNMSKVNVKRGLCTEYMLAGYELLLHQGLATNHSITVVSTINNNALEYYYKINGGEWVTNPNIAQNYYNFENLTYNTTYEIQAKAISDDHIEVLSDSYLFSTANVPTPIISFANIGDTVPITINYININLDDYRYRYRVDEGDWMYANDSTVVINATHNNHNITAEVLNTNSDTMVSVNSVIDYSIFAPDITFSERNEQIGAIMNKYVTIHYSNLNPFFRYRYKVNNNDYITATAEETEILLTQNDTVILAEVLDPTGTLMRTNEISIDYYDDTEYTIVLQQALNGTISSSVAKAKVGDTIIITATPNINYEINYITINSTQLYQLSFLMPRQNTSVMPAWKLALITKYRTRPWVIQGCSQSNCGYNDWRCVGWPNSRGGCDVCTNQPSPNCNVSSNGQCCGHFYSCYTSYYNCWGSWSDWTLNPCTPSDGCQTKICKGNSPEPGCIEP